MPAPAPQGRPGSPCRDGICRALPIMLGYLPVGFAFGVLAVKNGLTPALAVGMAALMFSGSGQFIFASLWGAGAQALSVVAAVVIINLRYMLMSAAESPWLSCLSRPARFLLGMGLTDETFAVHITALKNGWPLSLAGMLALNGASCAAWVCGCAMGAFMGGLVDDVRPLGLDFALTAMFIALLVPQCRTRLHTLAALFAGALSIALKCQGLDQWNIVLATVAGASLGCWLEGPRGRR